jgi:dTDP-4-amino-4,6-dideoxygalactose transaminase
MSVVPGDPIPFTKQFIAGGEAGYLQEALGRPTLQADGVFARRCEAHLSTMLGGAPVLLTATCTGALEIAARLIGLGPGDEVIMPSFTFVSTANAVMLAGARPRFVEVRADTMNLDEDQVEAAISDRTRAIWPVHYAGVGAAPDHLADIARRRGLWLVEDAAQCFGATYRGRPLGMFGALGTLSFDSQKNLSCGEGGALIVNDPALLERAYVLRDKGTNRRSFSLGLAARYSWVDIGSAWGLPELSAAVLLAQLEAANTIQSNRRAICERYRRGLDPIAAQGVITLPHCPPDAHPNAHISFFFTRTAAERQSLLEACQRAGVAAQFHYVPLHSSPFGASLGYTPGDLPRTEDLAGRLVRLPLFAGMTPDQADRVLSVVTEWAEKHAGKRLMRQNGA